MASIRRPTPPHHHHYSDLQTQNLHRLISPSPPPSSPLRARQYSSSIPYRTPLLLRLLIFFFISGFIIGLSLFSRYESDSDPIPADSELPLSPPPPEQEPEQKLIIVVTPTYNRASQSYFLHRLAQTLRLVPPPLLWIVVEHRPSAATAVSPETAEILRRAGVVYRHLICDESGKQELYKDRGVCQRNRALDHIEHHRLDGIVYFADDDNVYSLELFDRLREIREFGTWPVAMLSEGKSKAVLEGPVCKGKEVIGWHTNEKSKRLRRFHVDMSGFAFNSTLLWDPQKRVHLAWNAIRQLDTVKEGFQETTFIEQLVEDETEMEAVPSDCSKILNWHLHLDSENLMYHKGWKLSSNLDATIPL